MTEEVITQGGRFGISGLNLCSLLTESLLAAVSMSILLKSIDGCANFNMCIYHFQLIELDL